MEEISPQDAPPPIRKGPSSPECLLQVTQKHELKDSSTHRLLETYIYVSIVKCGN